MVIWNRKKLTDHNRCFYLLIVHFRDRQENYKRLATKMPMSWKEFQRNDGRQIDGSKGFCFWIPEFWYHNRQKKNQPDSRNSKLPEILKGTLPSSEPNRIH